MEAADVKAQERVIAAAQHIVNSLATSKNAADDMMRILSTFDNRLSDLLPAAAVDDSRFFAAENLILTWDSLSSDSEASNYLSAVDEIISAAGAESGDLKTRAEHVLQVAMEQLEDDFRHLMIGNTAPLKPRRLYTSFNEVSLCNGSGKSLSDFDPSVSLVDEDQHEGDDRHESLTSENWNLDLIHPAAVSDLKDIADRMISSGYGKELSQAYCSMRREFWDECLAVLGVDRMSIEDVQRLEWSTLNDKMKKWAHAVKVVASGVLLEENRLSGDILSGSEELKAECFAGSAKGCVLQLLNFGDAVAVSRRSPEKLFAMLDMCEALSDALPDLRELFPEDSGESVYDEAEDVLNRLGDAVRATLAEFGNAVQRKPSRKALGGCEIHPLTRYAMNYLKLLIVYNGLVDLILDGMDDDDDDDDGGESMSMSPTGRRLVLLISYLESNLEDKSKLYEDAGMQYVFLMNNLLYIVQKVKDSELRRFLGDDWIRKRRGKIRQYSTLYLRTSWTKVLACLKDDGLGGSGESSSVTTRAVIKEKLKNFNSGFDELHRAQTAWNVPDPQLREELRISISEKIIPAYRAFMGRFGGHLEGGRHMVKYIKYTSEDLENHLSDLFEGLPSPLSHPRRKLSS